MIIFDVLHYFFIIAVFFFALCGWRQFVEASASYFFHKREPLVVQKVKMAVLIPAYNEELLLPTTIGSLQCGTYDEALYDIVVIADNCTDGTEEVAKSMGVKVCAREDGENRGKGQALDWFLREYPELYRDFDVIVVVDADTLVHPQFLPEMALSFSDPTAQVVQGFYGVSNIFDSRRAALRAGAFNALHHSKAAGSLRLGRTTVLTGNGMAFRREILLRYGWPAQSIVEDLEFSLLLTRDRVRIDYNPDAMVFSEMASNRCDADEQMFRWERGRRMVAWRYSLPLLRLFYRDGDRLYLGALLDLVIPPMSWMTSLPVLLAVISFFVSNFLCLLALTGLASTVFFIVTGQIQRKAPRAVWESFLYAPLFIGERLIFSVRNLFRRAPEWVRARRGNESR